MGVADYRPAFCGHCEVAISVMERQDGALALVCACPEGRVPLDVIGLFALMFWLFEQLVPGQEAEAHRSRGTADVAGGEEVDADA